MSNYELYNKVLSAVNEDEGTFNAAARNWIESADAAPFEDEEAVDLFYTAKMACAAWRNKAINGRVSKLRMIESVRKIAAKKLANPYPEVEEKVEEIKEEVKPEEIEEKVEEKKHIFGVIEDVMMGYEQYDGIDHEKDAEKEVKEESKEEPKEEKRFFNKRKNR